MVDCVSTSLHSLPATTAKTWQVYNSQFQVNELIIIQRLHNGKDDIFIIQRHVAKSIMMENIVYLRIITEYIHDL
jgi:hypothetical protein